MIECPAVTAVTVAFGVVLAIIGGIAGILALGVIYQRAMRRKS